MNGTAVLEKFQGLVDESVAESLTGYHPERHAQMKSIRDAIWGTSRFYAWEVAVLDSPLLQRLRDIRQTGLAYLVYPTAVHTRFDHTLGVVTVASRIVRSINDKYPRQVDARINYTDHMRVRLSALLHDVGHSCLSHVSETIYGASQEFQTLIKHVNTVFGVTPKPHEIMSWLVVRSKPFKDFMMELKTKGILVDWPLTREDIDDIAGNIIGYRKDPTEKFLADIVNGPMDADKLDYLVRDAYFAGPTVVYDLDRFLHTVDAIEYPREEPPQVHGPKVVRLSVPISGVTALEQIIISKLMLFSYLYHHHKIRCVEGMYHEALKRWVELSQKETKKKKLPVIAHPVSFLSISDRSLLPDAWPPDGKGDRVLAEIVSMLTRRELYKRALVISRLFIPNIDTDAEAKSGLEALLRCSKDADAREELRRTIADRASSIMRKKGHRDQAAEVRKRFKHHHVLVDVPSCPTVEETEGVMVPVSTEASEGATEYVPLQDIFPIAKWVDAYNAIKWQGHVFALEEAVPFVSAAAQEVLASAPFHLQFTRQATELCKIAEPILPDYTMIAGVALFH